MSTYFHMIGRLAQEPRKFLTKAGDPGCSFNLARNYKGTVEYYDDITAYDDCGKNIWRYKRTGDLVSISGYFTSRVWEDKHGSKRKEIDLFATKCDFLPSGNRTEEPVVETPEPTETVPRKIACSLCEKTFTTARGLKVHLARSHKSIDPNEAQRELVEREQAGRTFSPTEYDGCDVPLLLEVGASDES